jgi:hypothetical protein
MATTPRFVVRDRKLTEHLTVFTAINPRYQVIDTTTNEVYDELQSRKAADDTARFKNQEA